MLTADTRAVLGWMTLLGLLLGSHRAFGQEAPPPPAEPYPAPSGSAPPGYVAPVAPPNAPAAPPPQVPPQPAPVQQPPAQYADPPLPGYLPPEARQPTPPPPPAEPTRPQFSVRLDPFNWIINGRLGLELEVEAFEFMTIEAVPQFVTTEAPPAFNLSGQPDILFQKSNGLGALAGSSIGAGFWLDGKAFKDSVLRVYLTNYSMKYVTRDNAGQIDSTTHTERRLMGFLGSHRRFGAFTFAGGIGLGVELNKDRRCFPDGAASVASATRDCAGDDLQIALDRTLAKQPVDLNGALHPAYIDIRFSLGFVF